MANLINPQLMMMNVPNLFTTYEKFISLPRDHSWVTTVVTFAAIIFLPKMFKGAPRWLRKTVTALVFAISMIMFSAILFTNTFFTRSMDGGMRFSLGLVVLFVIGFTLFLTFNSASKIVEQFQLTPEEENDLKKWNNQRSVVDFFTASCGLGNNCKDSLRGQTEEKYNKEAFGCGNYNDPSMLYNRS